MLPARFEIPERDRSRLRAIVVTINRDLSCLSLEGTVEDHSQARRGLIAAWAQLVDLLGLRSAAGVRECAACTNTRLRAATRRGHCWVHLPPCAPGTKGAGPQ